MNLRVRPTHICAAATGLVASTAVGVPAWAETGPPTDPAQNIAYQLGYLAPTVCCVAVIGVVIVFFVFFFVRRSKRR